MSCPNCQNMEKAIDDAFIRGTEFEKHRWRAELDEFFIINFMSFTKEDETLTEAINRLIKMEMRIALDPQVSSSAQNLREQGRQELIEEIKQWAKSLR